MEYTIICESCGKEFTTNRSNTKTCSADCYRIHRNKMEKKKRIAKKQPKPEISCKHCGKMFIPKDSRNTYCCRKCKEEAAKERNRLLREATKEKRKAKKIKCRYCGKLFVKTPEHRLYCSKECRDNETNKLKREDYEKNKKKAKAKNSGNFAISAHEAGMSYAEAQILDTLSKVPPIDTRI